jgi:hypothetical protein
MSDIDLAWQGWVPPDVQAEAVRRVGDKLKIHLVISHCDHSVDWIFEDYLKTQWEEGRVEAITILSKCGKPVEGAPKHNNLKIVTNLPNVGRCDHSYAHWMADFGEQPPKKNDEELVVVFAKDTNYQKSVWRNFDDMMPVTYLNGFSCGQISKSGKWGCSGKSVFCKARELKLFHLKGYQRGGGNAPEDLDPDFENPKYKTLGDFMQHYNILIQQPFTPTCYGGLFTTTAAQIRKQPTELWRTIETSLSRRDNLEEGHFVERLWAGLLTKRIAVKVSCSTCGR